MAPEPDEPKPEPDPEADRPLPPAGWFPDVHRDGWLRWWDGKLWTEHRTADPREAASGGEDDGPSSGDTSGHQGPSRGLLVVVAVVAAGLVVSLFLDVDSNHSPDSARHFRGEQQRVADVVDGMQRALANDEGTQACSNLLTPAFAGALASGSGAPCGQAIDNAVPSGRVQADLKVRSITVAGSRATVRLREGGDDETWRLVLADDAWRVAAISKD